MSASEILTAPMAFDALLTRHVGALRGIVAAVLGLTLVGAVHAQPPTIPLPSDLKLETPAADVPANVARFAGAWAHGAWDGVLPHVLSSRQSTARVALYAEGDQFYAAGSIRRYHEAFAQAGGVATFHLLPAFGGDGHRLVDRVEIWQSAAEDFLRRLNLSSR